MPRIVSVGALMVLIGPVLWAMRLVFGVSPWHDSAAALLAVTLVILGAISAVAMMLAPGSWVRNLASGLAAAQGMLATGLDIDLLWMAAMLITASAAVLIWTRTAETWFRAGHKPDRVPPQATALAVALLTVPAVLAVTADGPMALAGWLLAGASLALGWAYARALGPTLWAVRLAYPLAAIPAVVASEGAGIAVRLSAVAGITALAWTSQARLAVEPLVARRVDSVSILPEMIPADLLESAGLDRRGRPLEDS